MPEFRPPGRPCCAATFPRAHRFLTSTKHRLPTGRRCFFYRRFFTFSSPRRLSAWRGIVADRHVVEIPDEQAAEVDELPEIRLGRDRVPVHARVARGDAVDEEVHKRGLEHLGVNVVEHVLHHRVVRVGGIHARLADGAALALELSGAERVRPVEELRQVLDRFLLR